MYYGCYKTSRLNVKRIFYDHEILVSTSVICVVVQQNEADWWALIIVQELTHGTSFV